MKKISFTFNHVVAVPQAVQKRAFGCNAAPHCVQYLATVVAVAAAAAAVAFGADGGGGAARTGRARGMPPETTATDDDDDDNDDIGGMALGACGNRLAGAIVALVPSFAATVVDEIDESNSCLRRSAASRLRRILSCLLNKCA